MKVRTKVAALGVAAVSLGTLAAFAAWTSTVDGTGSATSTTSDAGAGDISAATVAADDLYPGATKSIYVEIKNDNAYPIVVTKIWPGWSQHTASTCAAGTVRTGAESDNTGLLQNGSATQRKIAGNGGTGVYKLTVKMSDNAHNNCKSQTFTIGDDPSDDTANNGADAMDTTNLHADVVSAASENGF